MADDQRYFGVEEHIVEVTRHDQDDIIVGRQYFVLFLDDASDGRLVASNVTEGL